ncbi:MAG TPA: malto-oligosyltrehalose trehalohydrolase [Stellaceae bacterium]|nr:malto-oligosyltrehalose trehalohydrolase [Stellaceae bacterium]
MKRYHHLPFGAEIVEGGVRFRFWAPKAPAVDLVLEGGPTIPMLAGPGGWHDVTTDRAAGGTRYAYRIDGRDYPDPASRFQPEDVYGPSEVIDPTAHDWQDTAWRGRLWHEIVLYELHTGTFSDTGDFAGVARHLDHLSATGITAIELMPVADFPGRYNWGYDGVLFFAPDSRYGRPEELKRLVEQCHARGISVLLDVVYNHFGPEGNYLSAYAPGFFTDRHHTPWGAAIDVDGADSRPVRDFFIENALYWLREFHLDGLRFDAVHAILDDSTPDLLTELAGRVRDTIDDRPIHLVLENDNNEARRLGDASSEGPYTAQWNDDFHHALRVLTSGESGGYYADYLSDPVDHLCRALTEGFAYQGEVSQHRDGRRRGEPSAGLAPTSFVSFIQNHDQVGNHAFGSRISLLAPAPRIRVAVALLLLSPAVPMLFMGEEWQADQPFPFFCDFGPELAEAVRVGRAKEFSRFPEFADPEMRARIPDPCAPGTRDSAILDWTALDRPPHDGWYRYYRELIDLRHREIVPRLLRMLGGAGQVGRLGPRAFTVGWRMGDGSTLSIAANFGDQPVASPALPGRLLFETGPCPAEALPPVYLAATLDERVIA